MRDKSKISPQFRADVKKAGTLFNSFNLLLKRNYQ